MRMPLIKPSGPPTASLGRATSNAVVPAMYPMARTLPPTQNRPRNHAARILDFVAHGAAGFNAAERKEYARPEDGILQRQVRNQAAGQPRCVAEPNRP